MLILQILLPLFDLHLKRGDTAYGGGMGLQVAPRFLSAVSEARSAKEDQSAEATGAESAGPGTRAGGRDQCAESLQGSHCAVLT